MKQQILVIHGGNLYRTPKEFLKFLKKYKVESLSYFFRKGWKESLQKDLGSNFQVIVPKMPNRESALYLEWKVWFEKILPFINNNVILIGHSLGGIFLAKYLAENKFPKKVTATFLIAAPFSIKNSKRNFTLPKSLSKLAKQGGKIYLYHSKDDKVVPFKAIEKYVEEIPTAKIVIFKNRGHFNQEKFPEIIKDIRALSK